MIVITGMHRSGTTIIGEFLRRAPSVSVIHEPFNRTFGEERVEHDYPIRGGKDFLYVDDILEYIKKRKNLRFKRAHPKDSLIKKILRPFVGGRSGIDYFSYRFFSVLGPRKIVLKDPFLSLSLKDKNNEKYVVVCRHPCAVWLSIKNMNWRSDPKKSSFIDTENELDEIDRFSLTWNKIYSQNFDRDNILFVTHEELCSEPLTSLKKMADFCGISWSEKFDKFIDENMVGGVVEKTKGQLHNFKRDSKSLAKAWVDKVSVEDEKRIKDITGEVVERIYGQWK